MHRNKTFAGIFLIFSIANFVLAAPALIRQRHFVTERADEPTGESKQGPAGEEVKVEPAEVKLEPAEVKVEPAATPPPVGSPEKLLTPSGLWTEELMNHLTNYLSSLNKDPRQPALPGSPYPYGSSPYGSHQGSSLPVQDPAGLVHEEVEPAATPPNHANYLLNENGKRPAPPSPPYPYGSSPYGSHQGFSLPKKDHSLWTEDEINDLAYQLLNSDPKRPALPGSPYGLHQGSGLPEQDPAGLVHEGVEPAATSPPVGSPSRPEKSLTPSGWWSDDKVLDYNDDYLLFEDSKTLGIPSSPYGSHQSSSSPELVPGSPGLLHEDAPWIMRPDAMGLPKKTEWWLKTWERPPSIWSKGGSSHTASHEQMLPPASVAQPSHDDSRPHSTYEVGESDTASHGHILPPASVAQPIHESDSNTNMSGWEEEEAKDVEELHPHL